MEAAKLLLNRGAEIKAKNVDGKTPLHFTTLSGYVEVVIQLLKEKANINTEKTKYGNALQAAVHNGKEILVQLLIEKQTNVNA